MIRSISSTLLLAATCIVLTCIAVATPATAQRSRPDMNSGRSSGAANSISWRGYVDDAATIFFRGDNMTIDDVRGRAVIDFRSNFVSRLPTRRPVYVRLVDVHGRGNVRIIQQPSAGNNFTAGVRVNDPQPGRGLYRFHLTWD